MDEATAAVDAQTDTLISTTIREAFRDRTLLLIAHRLHTIIDADAVLVLDAGKVAAYDTPAALLRDESSSFAGLVRETGPQEAAALRQTAIAAEAARAAAA